MRKLNKVLCWLLACILAIPIALIGPSDVQASTPGPNLVQNGNLSGGSSSWSFTGNGGVAGNHHFWLDPGATIYQKLRVPATNTYRLAATLATPDDSRLNAYLGVRRADNQSVIKETKLALGLDYSLVSIEDIELEAGDEIEIYSSLSGCCWVNGNNFVFQSMSFTPGNLISIPQLEAVAVRGGIPLSDIVASLPSEIAVVTDGDGVRANVAWDTYTTPSYRPLEAGTYTLGGTVTLIDGITNTNDVPLRVSVDITSAALSLGANLLLNPGFEEDIQAWKFNGAGYQTNNRKSGSRGFFLNDGSSSTLTQTVVVPSSGFYSATAFIATGGTGSKFGIRTVDGTILDEIDLPQGGYTSAPFVLGPFELEQETAVQVYVSGGNGWTNGDDFTLTYDLSRVAYNLLAFANVTAPSSHYVYIPREGKYMFLADVQAESDVTITVDGVSETIPAGEQSPVTLVTAEKQYVDKVQIEVAGEGTLTNARLILDLSDMDIDPPAAAGVAVEGELHAGLLLQGKYDYTDPAEYDEGTSEFKWFIADTEEGPFVPIAKSTGKTLLLTRDMDGKYIQFEVVPVNIYGVQGEAVRSPAYGPVKINWIGNPGFEHEVGGRVVGWAPSNGASTPNSNANARNGFMYGQIPAQSSAGELVYKIDAERTASYDLSLWARVQSGSGETEIGIRQAGRSQPIKSMTITPTGTYALFSLTDIPLEKMGSVEVYVKGNSGSANLYVDDFQLLIDASKPVPMYANLLHIQSPKQIEVPVIDEAKRTISFFLVYGTDLSKVPLSTIISEGAVTDLPSDSTIDLSQPRQLTITNGDLTQTWTISATVDTEKKVTLESDNLDLQTGFNWAVKKTNQFVMTGQSGIVNKDENYPEGDGTGIKPYIPSYWAGYYDRTAFYSRDFVHQAIGGSIVGLDEENFSMFQTFAKNATEARRWYALWAFNFDGSPHRIDYRSDTDFMREVPAQFEIVEMAYKTYLWTGDERYVTDEAMLNYYHRSMNDFIEITDLNKNGVAEGKSGSFNAACTYNERGNEHPIETGDCIGSQYQASLAYAEILSILGDEEGAAVWRQKAADLKTYFNEDWSVLNDDPNGLYARGIASDGTKYGGFGKENSWFMPLKQITEPGPRNELYLDFILEHLGEGIGSTSESPRNIEAYTYIPETYFPYDRNEDAWKWMKYIISLKDLPHERPAQGTNGDYPEISYTHVTHVIQGLMGIDANMPARKLTTTSRLVDEIGWIELKQLPIRDYELDVRHDGRTRTQLTNNGSQSLSWEARFVGEHDRIWANGQWVDATTIEVNGVKFSAVTLDVAAGETAVARVQALTEEVNVTELTELIDQANELYAGAVIGEEPGNYPALAKGQLHAAILAALAVRNNDQSGQSTIDSATAALEEAIALFLDSAVLTPPAAPNAPTGLVAQSRSSNQITLTWTASTSEGVAYYAVYKDGARVGTSETTRYTATGLSPSTTYTFTVRAVSTGELVSGSSVELRVATQPVEENSNPTPTPPPTTPPTKPTQEEVRSVPVRADRDSELTWDDVIALQIPAGALPDNESVNVEVVTDEGPGRSTYTLLSEVVKLTSTTATDPSKPLELNLKLHHLESLPEGSVPKVYYYNEKLGKWIYIGGTVVDDGTIRVEADQFAAFAVFAYEGPTFSDVDGHWAGAQIDRLIGMQVIQGYPDGSFKPDRTNTRAEFVTLLVRALGKEQSGSSELSSFGDNDSIKPWAKQPVATAIAEGWIQGYGADGQTLFKPDQEISRLEMAVIVSRIIGASGQAPAAFNDQDEIPTWGMDAVNQMVELGIMEGYPDGTFRPSQMVTRAEAAKIIQALLKQLKI